jgi:hypothetical protein
LDFFLFLTLLGDEESLRPTVAALNFEFARTHRFQAHNGGHKWGQRFSDSQLGHKKPLLFGFALETMNMQVQGDAAANPKLQGPKLSIQAQFRSLHLGSRGLAKVEPAQYNGGKDNAHKYNNRILQLPFPLSS